MKHFKFFLLFRRRVSSSLFSFRSPSFLHLYILKNALEKDRKRTDHLRGIVFQHAKWIARRLQRSLGYFNSPASERPLRPKAAFSTAKMLSRGRLQTLHDCICNRSTGRASAKRPSRLGRPPKTNPPADVASAADPGREFVIRAGDR